MFKPAVSSGKRAPLAPLLAFALLCAGCAAGASPPMKIVKEIEHANGLALGVPEGFEARRTEDGFVVEPAGDANARVRFPVAAGVSLVAGAGTPDGSGLKTKSHGGKEVRYGVEESDGGSGGQVYTLNVYEGVPGGVVRYSQAVQSEMGEPDFDLCWTLVGSTKYKPKNN